MNSKNEKAEIRILSSGGYVIHVDICNEASLQCINAIHKLYYALKKELSGYIKEIVTGITSLALFYDPRTASSDYLVKKIMDVWSWSQQVELKDLHRPRKFIIPVAYGNPFGPDLASIASWAGLKEEEVISLHVSRSYVCYTLGFMPGFIYLGEVDPKIAAPRLETPRTKIPRGSVGIAGTMTGIYGLDSPGGWRLIGRTPLTMFDHKKNPPIPIVQGDIVFFKPITAEDFERLKGVYVGDYNG